MTQHYMRILVRTEYIDTYPELFEAYKRTLGEAMLHEYGVEADWDTFTRMDGVDDEFTPDWMKPWSTLAVLSK